MPQENLTFAYCDQLVAEFEQAIQRPIVQKNSVYYTGVDLGTACIVLAVLDENRNPVAGAYRYADVVRDGMVVDYIGAVRIVRELKEELEQAGERAAFCGGCYPARHQRAGRRRSKECSRSRRVRNNRRMGRAHRGKRRLAHSKWRGGGYWRRHDRNFCFKGREDRLGCR